MKPQIQKGNIFSGYSSYIVGYRNPGDVTSTPPVIEVNKESGVEICSVKYSSHNRFEKRSGDAPKDTETRITILLEGGPWKQHMWLEGARRKLYTLNKPGDFIAWKPGWLHTWQAGSMKATMLTVSMRKKDVKIVLQKPKKLAREKTGKPKA